MKQKTLNDMVMEDYINEAESPLLMSMCLDIISQRGDQTFNKVLEIVTNSKMKLNKQDQERIVSHFYLNYENREDEFEVTENFKMELYSANKIIGRR